MTNKKMYSIQEITDIISEINPEIMDEITERLKKPRKPRTKSRYEIDQADIEAYTGVDQSLYTVPELKKLLKEAGHFKADCHNASKLKLLYILHINDVPLPEREITPNLRKMRTMRVQPRAYEVTNKETGEVETFTSIYKTVKGLGLGSYRAFYDGTLDKMGYSIREL